MLMRGLCLVLVALLVFGVVASTPDGEGSQELRELGEGRRGGRNRFRRMMTVWTSGTFYRQQGGGFQGNHEEEEETVLGEMGVNDPAVACFHAPTSPVGRVPPPNWTQTHDMPFYNDQLCLYSSQSAPNRSQTDPGSQCTQWHRRFCVKDAPLSKIALFFGFTRVSHAQPYTKDGKLPAFMQDLASFLLTRGPFAWLGMGWEQCTSFYPHPDELNEDFGEPLTDDCREVGDTEVFVRNWTKADVSVDCRDFSAEVRLHDGRVLR